MSDKTEAFDLAVVRRSLLAHGVSHEHVDIVAGLAVEYAMTAYKQGFANGFNDGCLWARQKLLRAATRLVSLVYDKEVDDLATACERAEKVV